MQTIELELTAEEHSTVMDSPMTVDWIHWPAWRAAFRKWAELVGEYDGLYVADLYYVQCLIDYKKDASDTALWQEYLLYLPTDGSVPDSAMADIELLAQGQQIDRSVGELLNEMSDFMINNVHVNLVHNYVFGPFSEYIAEYKDAFGGGDSGASPPAPPPAEGDYAYYPGTPGANDYEFYPGSAASPYTEVPGREDRENPYGVPIVAQGEGWAESQYTELPGREEREDPYKLSDLPDDAETDVAPAAPSPPPEDDYSLSDLPDQPPIETVVDLDDIRAENQRSLKEAQDPGTRLPFWQVDGYVLLGAAHPPEYYQHFLDRGAVAGWVTVVSRGNTLRRDPGLLQVVGSNDPDRFERIFSRFTSKRLEFV